MNKGQQIAVIYLAWLPYGISHFEAFIKSYVHHLPGHEHKLVIAFNGKAVPGVESKDAYIEFLQNNNISNVEYLHYESGQDIAIYKQACAAIDADLFLFLNTYSRLRAQNWLQHYMNNWNDKVGLIGASGSYANYLTAIKKEVGSALKSKASLGIKINKLKYLIKISFLYSGHFKKFPSPHVRTNAFFTSKAIFSSLRHGMVKNKMEAYFFETGKKSMTEQVLKMEYKCIIIDKNGKAFDMPDWERSKLFWNTNQDELLVSDNQTRIYDGLPLEEKKLFSYIAWG